MLRGIRLPKRSAILGILVFALALALGACGKGQEAANSAGSPAADAGGKVYVVGTDAAYKPFEYVNEKGEIVGSDIELIKKLAEIGGFRVDIRNIGWDALFQAVQNGEVDIAISAITITDERKKTYDFTQPYFEAHQLIVSRADNPVRSVEDLKNGTFPVGVQNGTTGHEVVKKILGDTNPRIRSFENTPYALKELENGGVDAVVADNAVVELYVKENPGSNLVTADDPMFEKEYYGIMVKKGNAELLNLLNSALDKAKEQGLLKQIFGEGAVE